MEPPGLQRLAGRRIVITGAGSGIGAATARLFAREGARLAICDRDRLGLEAVAAEIGALALVFDVTDYQAAVDAMAQAASSMGGIDGLVNCAGISVSMPFAETGPKDWNLAINVNLTGVYNVCHAAVQFLQAVGSSTIVNMASAVALQPLRGRAAYAASKAGVVAFTKVLAMELAPRTRCNVLSPGAVDTPLVRETFPDPADIALIASRYAMLRMGQAQELADAALFLTGPESSFITGSNLSVDGGRVYY